MFKKLDGDNQVLCLLFLTGLVINRLSISEGFELAAEAMEDCWRWLEKKNISGFDLYARLENANEHDVMTYMDLECDESKLDIWACIANALAYTVAEAYKTDGETYMPQTIECVDLGTVMAFFNSFEKIYLEKAVIGNIIQFLLSIKDMEITKWIHMVKGLFGRCFHI